MSILGQPYALTVEENADMSALVFTYYPSGLSGSPFDFTGYLASMDIRVNVGDAAPVLTLTPTLGGALGTVTVNITAADANTLVTALPNLTGVWDIRLTAPGGAKSYFVPASPITVVRRVTRS